MDYWYSYISLIGELPPPPPYWLYGGRGSDPHHTGCMASRSYNLAQQLFLMCKMIFESHVICFSPPGFSAGNCGAGDCRHTEGDSEADKELGLLRRVVRREATVSHRPHVAVRGERGQPQVIVIYIL